VHAFLSRDGCADTARAAALAWMSSDSAVAWVDGSGVLHTDRPGTARLTASHAGEAASRTVRVFPPLRAVVLSPRPGAILVGDTVRIAAVPHDAGGPDGRGARASVLTDAAIRFLPSRHEVLAETRAPGEFRAWRPGTDTLRVALGSHLGAPVEIVVRERVLPPVRWLSDVDVRRRRGIAGTMADEDRLAALAEFIDARRSGWSASALPFPLATLTVTLRRGDAELGEFGAGDGFLETLRDGKRLTRRASYEEVALFRMLVEPY
jgi:hypothetical protein